MSKSNKNNEINVSKLQHLIDTKAKIVFMCGASGVGKTTLIAALYNTLFEGHNSDYSISLNPNGNIDGVKHLHTISVKLMNGEFPNLTPRNAIKEIDWKLKRTTDKVESIFTLVDLAGENIQDLFFTKRDGTANITSGDLYEPIQEYLNGQVDMTLMIVINCKDAFWSNRIITTFFDYISRFKSPPQNIAFVITQWGEEEHRLYGNGQEFIARNTKMTYIKALDITNNLQVYTCTVGQRDKDNRIILPPSGIIDYSCYKPIADWLFQNSLLPYTVYKKDEKPSESYTIPLSEIVNLFNTIIGKIK